MPKVLVPFADGMEEMEAVIVVDVLRRAGIEVVSAGISSNIILASRGIKLVSDSLLSEIDPSNFDMIVLPGGNQGTKNLNADPLVSEILKKFKKEDRWIGAICAAPNVLLTHNILQDQKFTAFPGSVPSNEKYTGSRLELSDKILTSIGPGSAFEFSLKIVELLSGVEKRKEVEKNLQLPA
ncbi:MULTISPECIES: DJ-1 family glyoxalase III [unclassified Leptospira]|uniref:DJ-1 family glyoxalase III n=1 Tax=unclassified Leptospira TaxID=2633828 RepID=UPI0002BF591C|nr:MULTISPECIES: DJ-1 family glyoxalase III [unclassified Leptospira]EMJ96938.1 DJ-1 family protein [Leptospira sp. B5-022]MCR1794596.1 DJ-1/PfpI family protein [Leptospira sp. id769339]